ncbi:class I SAM-dependent methyltransferase [Thioalkalivibrio thiocyanodenitrificans]|uniref:class I SAM-dependent methyltransferase n=1 Tax=Thioalkalivibrio thiocyanodenitrificans TaxID=243063 RepID=UPI00036F4EA9|nr:class I SAM-dependent methyltransferase [Thioalkalivibrio thiocyanodenitrificans]
MTSTEQDLLQQANRICESRPFREALWRHLPDPETHGDPGRLDAHIHPRDQMLLHSLRHHGDAHVALSQYYNVALQQYNAMRQILHLFHPPPHEGLRFLDFACGYGRLIRLLSLSMPARNITACEIQPEAVDYVRERFGVRGMLSHLDPEQFKPGETFDFIWVASLFSHLPEQLFHQWLARLWALVNEHGALCFSVHDAALLPEGLELPDPGILYGEGSEIPELGPAHYGTAYVSEDFVMRAVRTATGGEANCFRIPKALAHEQDIYVVTRSDVSGLAAFRRGPWGWVDERRVSPEGELYLRGWAASLDDGPLAHVNISVNGQPHTCPTGLPRDDVAHVFGDARLRPSGWSFHLDLAGNTRAQVEVTAITAAGEKALLYVATLPVPAMREASTDIRGIRGLLARLLGVGSAPRQ